MTSGLEATLRSHRAVTLALLVALTLLAWVWLLTGAGMSMDPWVPLPTNAIAEHPMDGMAMEPARTGSAGSIALTLSMWWTMMVAMMLPSAVPVILLYAKTARRPDSTTRPATGTFLLGYLAAWGVFSLLATALQLLLDRVKLLGPEAMASASPGLSIMVLFAAGLYQVTPLKDACLRNCRNPAVFLSRYFRPGTRGAFRMGILHGTFCVGCCWLLMMLLFVVGVMNLVWIAVLTIVVASEKLLPGGHWIRLGTGLALVGWALLMAFQYVSFGLRA